jgi:hypothetical protein
VCEFEEIEGTGWACGATEEDTGTSSLVTMPRNHYVTKKVQELLKFNDYG